MLNKKMIDSVHDGVHASFVHDINNAAHYEYDVPDINYVNGHNVCNGVQSLSDDGPWYQWC